MENEVTIARPYAKAAFEVARDTNTLQEWLEQLALLGEVAKHYEVTQVLNDPRLTEAQKINILEAVCQSKIYQGKIGEQQKQFLSLLAEYGRLSLLNEIYELFSAYKADFERVIDVRLTSATPLEGNLQNRFAEVLSKRLGRQVDLVCDTDPELIGGAIIRAGDQVIDGSVKSRLERLVETLIA